MELVHNQPLVQNSTILLIGFASRKRGFLRDRSKFHIGPYATGAG
jgi:hypothetical protein